jgi:phytoene dehydrogenase-like protein
LWSAAAPAAWRRPVAAARGGAKTLLLERYGHLGGMSTGGLVNIIPNLGDIYGRQHIGGFCQELIDRLAARGAACFPEKRFWGGGEPAVVDRYMKANMTHFYIRKNRKGDYAVLYTAVIDPEVAKDELNAMVLETGAVLLLHTWVTEPIMEGNVVKGVIAESKSGRQAILGRVVIDCSAWGSPAGGGGRDDGLYDSRFKDSAVRLRHWLCNVDRKGTTIYERRA